MERCRTCWWYNPTTWQGKEYACQFYVPEPETCAIYSRLPPVDLCRSCEHARFSYPDRPFCRVKRPADEQGCSGYTVRRPTEPLPCPTCGLPLQIERKRACCPEGHVFALRQSKRPCPRCGRLYATFGIDNPQWAGQYRDVYRLCPECGWHEMEKGVYVGPALGRGYGGQHWSPRTGRVLVRR